LRQATLGPQSGKLAGARAWLLPNPSGLNANYQLPALVTLFRSLREATDHGDKARPAAQARARR
ncbi:MAG TPA: hypothetical protein VFI86_06940, partial [Burkholderiales bacterium]|nr:hypothetical protein [Burkholderiales bacterium]